MKRNAGVVIVVAAALGLMLWAGARKSPTGGAAGSSNTVGLSKGSIAPDFELVDLKTGRPARLSDYRGKGVLLNFWATWCGPCKVEIPWFVDLQKQYGPQGFEILGIAMDDAGRDAILEFAGKMHVNYTLLQGTDKVGDAYAVNGFPTSYYVGRDGRVVNVFPGLASHREVEDNVKAVLNTRAAPVSAQAQPAAAR